MVVCNFQEHRAYRFAHALGCATDSVPDALTYAAHSLPLPISITYFTRVQKIPRETYFSDCVGNLAGVSRSSTQQRCSRIEVTYSAYGLAYSVRDLECLLDLIGEEC